MPRQDYPGAHSGLRGEPSLSPSAAQRICLAADLRVHRTADIRAPSPHGSHERSCQSLAACCASTSTCTHRRRADLPEARGFAYLLLLGEDKDVLAALAANAANSSQVRIILPFWESALHEPVLAQLHEDATIAGRTQIRRHLREAHVLGEIQKIGTKETAVFVGRALSRHSTRHDCGQENLRDASDHAGDRCSSPVR